MTFLRCLVFDMRASAPFLGLSVGISCVASLIVLGGAWLQAASLDLDWRSFSFGDNLFSCLTGMLPPRLERLDELNIPVGWLLLCLGSIWAVVSYSSESVRGMGMLVLCRARRRSLWFLAKICWAMLSVLLYWLICYATIAMASFAVSGDLAIEANAAFGLLGNVEGYELCEPPCSLGGFLEVMLCVGVCSGAILSIAAIGIGPIVPFFSWLALLVVSLFSTDYLLPGCFLMGIRHALVPPTPSLISAVFLELLVMFFAVVAAVAAFDRANLGGAK